MSDIFSVPVTRIDGSEATLEAYRGDVLLVVNTASKCGFTPQYKGLQSLHEEYESQGLKVLGFPCNQFGKQEPGDEGEIQSFCELNFGVTFDMYAKVDVNGANAHPLFEQLKSDAPGVMGTKAVKWNFTKFLVNREGKVLKRFAPKDAPDSLRGAIEAALG